MIEQTCAPELPLHRALLRAGLVWSELARSADQIILFGSRAAGLARSNSDWDLLCVGSHRSVTAPGLDLVCITPARLASKDWLTSELAGHVACHGRWLLGSPEWTHAVACGPEAAQRKRRRIAAHLAALERVWPLLPPLRRLRRLTLVRRDLQRYALLASGHPIPPTASLDLAWSATNNPPNTLVALATAAGAGSPFVEAALAPLTMEPRHQNVMEW